VTKQPPAPARQMHDLPGSNPIRPGRRPEDRLRDLQRRFRAVSARHDRTIKLSGYYRRLSIAALAAIVAFAVVWGLSSHWPVMTTPRQNAKSAATIEQAQIQVIDGDTIWAGLSARRLRRTGEWTERKMRIGTDARSARNIPVAPDRSRRRAPV
jgi:hypothetical protein